MSYTGVNQVQTFLTENKGPGVQHIAFRTDDIVGVVSSLRTNLVPFITPPPEYYTLVSDDTDCVCNVSVESLRSWSR